MPSLALATHFRGGIALKCASWACAGRHRGGVAWDVESLNVPGKALRLLAGVESERLQRIPVHAVCILRIRRHILLHGPVRPRRQRPAQVRIDALDGIVLVNRSMYRANSPRARARRASPGPCVWPRKASRIGHGRSPVFEPVHGDGWRVRPAAGAVARGASGCGRTRPSARRPGIAASRASGTGRDRSAFRRRYPRYRRGSA